MAVRLIAATLTAIWLILLLLGKGGFVHLLILNALGVASVDLMTVLRSRVSASADQTFSASSASENQ